MHRSLWARSAATGCFLCARFAHGGAHEQPRYALEGVHIVVEHDGMRDLIDVDCDEPLEMKHREERLLIACGGAGIAIYNLDDPWRPRFVGRRPTRGGPCVGIASDDTCIVRTEKIRASIVSHAPHNVVRLTACGVEGKASIGGRIRTLDVVVDGARCSQGPVPADPFTVEVTMEAASETETRIILEHDATDVVDDEIRDAVAKVADELESRIPKTWKVVRAYERPGAKRYWYGWQTILVDASAALTAATVLGIPIAIAGYAFGPPIVHWVHGQVKRGFISLLLRLGPPAAGLGVGTLVGLAAGCSGASGCGSSAVGIGSAIGTAVGAISGVLVAPIWDAIVAFDPPVHPVVLPADGGAAFGFGGSF